jgi:hypothetical protein
VMLTLGLVWFGKNEKKTREFCFPLQACVIFHHLLMYMGDAPSRRSRLGMELTDVIFDGPLKHVRYFFKLCYLDKNNNYSFFIA